MVFQKCVEATRDEIQVHVFICRLHNKTNLIKMILGKNIKHHLKFPSMHPVQKLHGVLI